MMSTLFKGRELKAIFIAVLAIFAAFLALPFVEIIYQAFSTSDGFGFDHFATMLSERNFATAFGNSITIASVSALISTILAFILAYTIHYTNLNGKLKKAIQVLALAPMFLPTITYGFAIIYSLGKQGFLTKNLGINIDIYGFNGLLIGYLIYTLPIAFLLIFNAMKYIDKKFMIVSKVMGDSNLKTFLQTIIRPLLGTMAASFVQCFFLCFTDYGIPASVGGQYQVIATVLYEQMMGSIPDFNRGAVVAIVMLLPSIISIALLCYLQKYNVRYSKISQIELKVNKLRDAFWGALSAIILVMVLSMFIVIFLMPFIQEWPYRMAFTTEHISSILSDSAIIDVYLNSLFVAALTAVIGLFVSYGAALITARSSLAGSSKFTVNSIALITNTIPGMVIGIAYLMLFSGSTLQNTFALIIICNVVHFFSTPYLMLKSSLEKLNKSWENTALLMGDSWFKTLRRIITPNIKTTILEVLGYYFVNAMVTISAVIFIAGAQTMVITAKIKELQYFGKFNEIFVLSILILLTNLVVKGLLGLLAKKRVTVKKENNNKITKTKGELAV
ncbi:ABC transporter permease subunit [Megamonas hypermegale]|uniref:ABC transporter permease subunit n=1 Tax=Megamonas hypermegale TaxID=158847 RepID=UPI003209A020